jgi:hypothetical protein
MRKEGRALRVSFVAEDVFHGFIAPGPIKDSLRVLATKTRMGRHVGAWWRRPQGREERSSPDCSEPRRVDTKPLTTDTLLPVRGTRQGI